MSLPNEHAAPAASALTRLQAHLAPRQSTILIAEDDAISARVLDATLARLGYTTITTRNGTQAWEQFNRKPVRIIVSDWMMPQLDGFGLCEKVRARSETAYTYFILLTANQTSATNYELASAAGVDDLL